ncbi:MAG: FAD-dependent oxidoreductase, partial [Spirochaetaceae bacterium]|nr:FAD-dependent oxidoreductase [Spirochaetaceae bacterium]
DAILIGTGQATGTLVHGLVKLGQHVAVIERDRVGGTCVNWGCTPTKTIVASARTAHVVRRAGDFGIDVPEFSVNFNRVMERQNTIRNDNSQELRKYLEQVTDFYEGSAAFVSDTDLQVGEHILRGKRIYIHTGARAREKDETRGLVKFLVNANSQEILGAAILGVGGDEIINGIAAWMYTGLPYTDFQRAVMVLPTVAELMPWVLENLEPLK